MNLFQTQKSFLVQRCGVEMDLKKLALTVLVVVFSSTLAYSDQFEDLEVGAVPPDFTLKDLADREYALSENQGEVVVIQFGSSTTLPYIEQMKPINGLIKKYRREPVTFLIVYTREQQFDWQAEDYFAKHERAKGLRYQFGIQSGQRMIGKVLVDDMEESVYKAYGAVPAGVFIVDTDGNLAYKSKVVKAGEVETILEKLM
jgi:peroxiredoxin